MTDEQWREVPGMPGLQVSSHGRAARDGHITTGWLDPRGYRWIQHASTRFRLHRMIARVFLDMPERGVLVRHLNDDPSDNRLENLALGTQSDNMRDRLRNGNDPNRRKTHCAQGHPFSSENTHHAMIRGRPVRICITCRRNRVNASAARRRARKAAA